MHRLQSPSDNLLQLLAGIAQRILEVVGAISNYLNSTLIYLGKILFHT